MTGLFEEKTMWEITQKITCNIIFLMLKKKVNTGKVHWVPKNLDTE